VLDELSDVVVTRGAKGAQYFHKGRLVAESPAPRVDVRDSVGAGDAAVASMALSLALGHGPDELLRRAVVAGSLATRAPGAQGSLATRKEVEQWLQREW
jgi:sugar/nucleoside kinase (ribokinase family)